jgi:hypothetical protein
MATPHRERHLPSARRNDDTTAPGAGQAAGLSLTNDRRDGHRDVEHPANRVPRLDVTVLGQVLDRLVQQGQEHRVPREVVPIAIERRGEGEDTSAADAPLDERGSAVIEPREDTASGPTVRRR